MQNKRPFQYVALAFTVLFLLFAAFQYNDSDSLIWIAIYGSAALLSILVFLVKINKIWLLAFAAAYLAGAVHLWPPTFEGITQRMSFSSNIEEARESLGLGICFLVVVYYYFATRVGGKTKEY